MVLCQYEFAVSILKIRSDPIRSDPKVLSIEWYINTNSPYRSFYFIYLSVVLSCRTGSFPLSLRVVLRLTVSFYPSLYHVVPDLFVVSLKVPFRSCLCLSSSSSNRIYRSVSPFRSCSCSSSSSSFDRIHRSVS